MKTFSVEWPSCHSIVLCRLLLSARMTADPQNIEKQTPQFLFPSSVKQLNALDFFSSWRNCSAERNSFAYDNTGGFCVLTFSVMEPLLACVFCGHKETRHYTSWGLVYHDDWKMERIPIKLCLVWNFLLVCVLPSCYSTQAFAIRGICHLLKDSL